MICWLQEDKVNYKKIRIKGKHKQAAGSIYQILRQSDPTFHLSLLRTTPPTASPPGKRTPSGTASATWAAIATIESSGMRKTAPAAATADAAAAPKKTAGGVLRATPASGRRPGARSTACAINGNTLSLDASKTPRRSLSSAKIRSGAAVVRLKPAFSRRVNTPSWAV